MKGFLIVRLHLKLSLNRYYFSSSAFPIMKGKSFNASCVKLKNLRKVPGSNVLSMIEFREFHFNICQCKTSSDAGPLLSQNLLAIPNLTAVIPVFFKYPNPLLNRLFDRLRGRIHLQIDAEILKKSHFRTETV